jgi:hypothetical protein
VPSSSPLKDDRDSLLAADAVTGADDRDGRETRIHAAPGDAHWLANLWKPRRLPDTADWGFVAENGRLPVSLMDSYDAVEVDVDGKVARKTEFIVPFDR